MDLLKILKWRVRREEEETEEGGEGEEDLY
jgi:hypothetical protein